ncbi:hypothetical protein ANCCAN_24052 [Ancylostoma caninum]|uniref:Secreted protein n=1 Tax=Ancylostoma caninum TaxID=29170 RepID=A0A368FH30_ANCCA|nr:hypothetical protein ANCCAN_24052 [Ancylostoma caninum]
MNGSYCLGRVFLSCILLIRTIDVVLIRVCGHCFANFQMNSAICDASKLTHIVAANEEFVARLRLVPFVDLGLMVSSVLSQFRIL